MGVSSRTRLERMERFWSGAKDEGPLVLLVSMSGEQIPEWAEGVIVPYVVEHMRQVRMGGTWCEVHTDDGGDVYARIGLHDSWILRVRPDGCECVEDWPQGVLDRMERRRKEAAAEYLRQLPESELREFHCYIRSGGHPARYPGPDWGWGPGGKPQWLKDRTEPDVGEEMR